MLSDKKTRDYLIGNYINETNSFALIVFDNSMFLFSSTRYLLY